MHGEMSDATYNILMPGPWPGPPQPFRKMRVFYQEPPWGDIARGVTKPAGPSCGSCPLSMHCLSGRLLYPLFGDTRRMTICRRCAALLWWQVDTIYICYRLGYGIFPRCSREKVTCINGPDSFDGRLSYTLAATVGETDPDQIRRHFPSNSTCWTLNQFGDCACLYHRWLKEHESNPIHDQANPFITAGRYG